MRKQYKIITILLISVFIGCKSNTNLHSHDGQESHSHQSDNTSEITSDYFGDYDLEDEAYGTKTRVTITKGHFTIL